MRNRRNHYRVLHVQPDAPGPVLKSSFRALMLSLEMHPDRGGEHWNAASINEAYAVLSDPVRRAEYDRTLDPSQAARRRDAGAAGPAGSPASATEPRADSEDCCLFCGSTTRVAGAVPGVVLCGECRSPLTPAGTRELEASGRRAARRVTAQGAIRYFEDWPQAAGHAGRILDVSPRGLKFSAREPVALFRILKIEGPLLDAVVRVVVCDADGPSFAVGAQFYTVQFRSDRGTFLSVRA